MSKVSGLRLASYCDVFVELVAIGYYAIVFTKPSQIVPNNLPCFLHFYLSQCQADPFIKKKLVYVPKINQ